MFGLLKPRSPLTTARQVDIELLLRRNVEVLGPSTVRQSENITDISAWQLDRLRGQARIDRASEQVLAQMPAAVTPCRLAMHPAEEMAFPSTYVAEQNDSAAVITLSDETVADPLRTVMELAYQYAAHFWHRVTDGRELDVHPRTTNLMPVCCGLGVLASDACLYDNNWNQAGWTGWSISRAGYYNAEEIGYALALLCRTRYETRPEWIDSLRLDSKVAFERAQRFFAAQQRAGHRLLYDSDTIPNTKCDARELADGLTSTDAALAYASALALTQREELPASVADAAIAAIDRGDVDLSPLATRVLGRLRSLDTQIESALQRLIVRGTPPVQSAAVQSASELGMALEAFQPQITRLLDQASVDPLPLIRIITGQRERFAAMAPKICQLISQSLRHDDAEWTQQLLECLQSIAADPQAIVEKAIRSPKQRQQVLEQLSERPFAS